jgi:hypothetical protein
MGFMPTLEKLVLEKKMPAQKNFLQNCPVCGRPLEISIELCGRTLNCEHCGGHFIACDPSNPKAAAQNTSEGLLHRADQLLDLCARKLTWRIAG